MSKRYNKDTVIKPKLLFAIQHGLRLTPQFINCKKALNPLQGKKKLIYTPKKSEWYHILQFHHFFGLTKPEKSNLRGIYN